MSSELLSICIPTYNRARILGPLLADIAGQLAGVRAGTVALYISDNASPDETPRVLENFRARSQLPLTVVRNPSNCGISRNLLNVIRMGKGRFIWTLGDDELLQPGALPKLVEALHRHDPGFVLMFDARDPSPLPAPGVYANYRSVVAAVLKLGSLPVVAEHTLLSCNLFRSQNFDWACAEQNLDTFFPHMYGMLRPLQQLGLPVLLPDFPVIATREKDRGTPADGVWANLDQCWMTYLSWLRQELQLPELDPQAPSRLARQAMLRNMRQHPLAYLRKNWRAAFQPSAYRFLFSRLWVVRKPQ